MLGISRLLGTAALSLILVAAAPLARAQDTTPEVDPVTQHRRTEIMLYIWGVSIHGKADSRFGEAPIDVSFSDLLDNLNFAVMLHGRMQVNEDWSLVTDLVYAHLRADDQSRQVKLGPFQNVVINGKLEAELAEWLWELNAGYKLFQFGSLFSRSESDPRKTFVEMYFGGRLYSLDPDIKVSLAATTPIPGLNPSRKLSIGKNETWVDPVVGLRFGIDLSRTSQLVIMGDVGGFDLGGGYCSQFSWSQTTALSWDFADSWRLHMGYRFLDFKRDFDQGKLDLQERGPFVALGYVF